MLQKLANPFGFSGIVVAINVEGWLKSIKKICSAESRVSHRLPTCRCIWLEQASWKMLEVYTLMSDLE